MNFSCQMKGSLSPFVVRGEEEEGRKRFFFSPAQRLRLPLFPSRSLLVREEKKGEERRTIFKVLLFSSSSLLRSVQRHAFLSPSALKESCFRQICRSPFSPFLSFPPQNGGRVVVSTAASKGEGFSSGPLDPGVVCLSHDHFSCHLHTERFN